MDKITRSKTSRDENISLSEEMVTKICAQQANMICVKLDERLNKMEKSLTTYVSQVNDNSLKIKQLEQKVDRNEQYQRLNNLRIYGIKENKSENEDSLLNTISMLLTNKLDIKISTGEVDRCHRIGQFKEGKNRAVLVRFLQYSIRSRIYKSKKQLKNTGYVIREDLTNSRVNLVKLAVEKYGITNVWTTNGKIYINKNNTKLEIRDANDI